MPSRGRWRSAKTIDWNGAWRWLKTAARRVTKRLMFLIKPSEGWVQIGTVVMAVLAYFQWQILLATDNTQKSIQRAFVIPRPIEMLGFDSPADTREWQIVNGWENAGATPTRDLKIFYWFNPQNFDEVGAPESAPVSQPGVLIVRYRQQNVVFTPPDMSKAPGHLTFLGPHQTSSNAIALPGASMERVRAGRAALFVGGLAMYRDQFGDRHITMSCKMIDLPEVDFVKSKADRIALASSPDCPKFNCADGECAIYKGLPWLPADAIP